MAITCKYLTVHEPDDIRVAGTRIGLEHLLSAYFDGLTAEGLVANFPSLTLEQVYGVLAYYWGNRDEVDAYMARWRKGCDERYEAWKKQPEPEVVKRLREIAARRVAQ